MAVWSPSSVFFLSCLLLEYWCFAGCETVCCLLLIACLFLAFFLVFCLVPPLSDPFPPHILYPAEFPKEVEFVLICSHDCYFTAMKAITQGPGESRSVRHLNPRSMTLGVILKAVAGREEQGKEEGTEV